VLTRVLEIVAALVCVLCVNYLLTNPMDRTQNFLTRYLGKIMFPRLDPYRQQQRTAVIAGLFLVIILSAAATAFVIKHMNNR
jgi:hypothetical protein